MKLALGQSAAGACLPLRELPSRKSAERLCGLPNNCILSYKRKLMWRKLICFILVCLGYKAHGQSDSLLAGFLPKKARIISMEGGQARTLRNSEAVVLVEPVLRDTSVVMFSDGSFAKVPHIEKAGAIWVVSATDSGPGGPKPPGGRPIGWPKTDPPKTPKGPKAHETQPMSSSELKELLKKNNIPEDEVQEKLQEARKFNRKS